MVPIIDSYNQIFVDKTRIMAVFAHPDDLELYCGGTIARLVADNKIVRSIKVTSGDMGSRQDSINSSDLKNQREAEDSQAMTSLGILPENNIYLHIPDGTVDNSLDIIGKIAEQIRIFKPDLIITHNPEDKIIRFAKDINWVNHRDHLNTALSTIDAAYPYARDLLFFPKHFENTAASSHSVAQFLLVDYYDHPDLVHIDVTDTIDRRIVAHSRHSSQYSLADAQDSADFFTTSPDSDRRFERFRYVVAD